MSYRIKKIQLDKAKKIGVTIASSSNKKKKLDVFKDGSKVGSIGATGYKDYGTYLEELPKKDADTKRKNYLARHKKEPKTKDGKKTNSYYADKILW